MDPQIFSQTLSAITGAAGEMAPRLTGFGLTLLTYLGVIQLSWRLTMGVLKEADIRGQLVGLLPLGVTLGIVAWIIGDLASISKTLLDGFDWISSTLTGSQGGDPLSVALAQVMKVVDAMWVSLGATGDKGPDILDMLMQTVTGGAAFWLKIITIVLLLVTAAITGGMFILSQVLAGIAIALGPVFLPFLVLKPLNFMATGWIRFLMTSAAMKMIGVVMLALSAAMYETTSKIVLSAAQADAATVDFTAALAALFVAAVQLILALQIPGIANGILSGSVSVAFDTSPATAAAGGAMRSVGHGYDGAKAGIKKAAEIARKFKG